MYAEGFEGLQIIPILIITPLVFRRSFILLICFRILAENILMNPVLYLISGFRYSFYEVSDVSLFTSTLTILTSLIGCIIFITYTFSKGYRIKD